MSVTLQSSLFAELPDHASEADDRALAIDRVGIKGLRYPITVMDRQNGSQATVADVELTVSLPPDVKGTHMSRFVEILNAVRGEVTLRNIPEILGEVQRRLEADDAHLRLTFPYFVTKKAPVSGAESLMGYECAFDAALHGHELVFSLGVEVPVTSLCPCSKAVSEYGAHNQRSLVTVRISGREFVWIEDVIERVEAAASAPLYALLKREDEKFVTEQAYDNPRFVEDLVRDAVIGLRELPGVRELRVSVENLESIHNHSAWAVVDWSADDAAKQLPLDLPPSERERLPFGAWVRQQRQDRSLSQLELADQLGVSASYLSRVESGDKMLSVDGLCRLATVLGQDEVKVQLRAGVVPRALLEVIETDPEGFLRWAESHR